MSDELERAKSRLSHGRLLLEQQKSRCAKLQARDLPLHQSKFLLRNMEMAVSSMEKHLALLERPS